MTLRNNGFWDFDQECCNPVQEKNADSVRKMVRLKDMIRANVDPDHVMDNYDASYEGVDPFTKKVGMSLNIA